MYVRNINEARALMERYRSITKDDIIKKMVQFAEHEKMSTLRENYFVRWESRIKIILTGFGNVITCTLCLAVDRRIVGGLDSPDCDQCIWRLNYPSMFRGMFYCSEQFTNQDDEVDAIESYNQVNEADTIESYLKAIRKRADIIEIYIKKAIEHNRRLDSDAKE